MGREHHDLCFVCNRKIGKDAFTFRICWLILSAISIFQQQQCHKHVVLLICITVWNCKFWVLQVVPRTKQGRVRYWKSILALVKLFCLDRFVWKYRWLHWHSFASEVYYRFYSTFCIYWYVILERMELIAIAIYCISFYLRNLVEQAIHFVFIKIYIENKICCCCNHKIMKLPLTINLGLL